MFHKHLHSSEGHLIPWCVSVDQLALLCVCVRACVRACVRVCVLVRMQNVLFWVSLNCLIHTCFVATPSSCMCVLYVCDVSLVV